MPTIWNTAMTGPPRTVNMDVFGLQGRAPSFTRKEKEDPMTLDLTALASQLVDRVLDRLAARLSQRLDGVEVEDDAEREFRLATERREAENKRMRDMIARDLAYRERQRQWLLQVTPRPQHPAPGGWL